LGQTIETGRKRGRRIESARAATRVTSYELEDVRRQVIFQIKKAFSDALIAQASEALATANLATLDELERIQRFRAERGDISKLELTRIQLQRFAFERDAADAGPGGVREGEGGRESGSRERMVGCHASARIPADSK